MKPRTNSLTREDGGLALIAFAVGFLLLLTALGTSWISIIAFVALTAILSYFVGRLPTRESRL